VNEEQEGNDMNIRGTDKQGTSINGHIGLQMKYRDEVIERLIIKVMGLWEK